MKTVRVFIASPGDVSEERDIASLVVGELNRIFANPFGVDLDAIRWETHAWPDIGHDAQDVINKQIRRVRHTRRCDVASVRVAHEACEVRHG